MRRALILASALSKKDYSGGSRRLRTIKHCLNASGYQYEVITREDSKKYKKSNQQYDLIVIVSFANIVYLRNIKHLSNNVWLDSTDSLLSTRAHGLGRNKVLSFLKGFIELYSVLRNNSRLNFITFISKSDHRADSKLYRSRTCLILPNILPFSEIEKVATSSERNIFFVGDLNYNANRRAVAEISNFLRKFTLREPIEISVVTGSITSNKPPKIFQNGNRLIYRSQLSDFELYAKSSIHIAPIWNSVGVKNKVVEPAYLGLTVLAASPSLNGIQPLPNIHVAENSKVFWQMLIALIQSNSEHFQSNSDRVDGGKNPYICDQTSLVIKFLTR